MLTIETIVIRVMDHKAINRLSYTPSRLLTIESGEENLHKRWSDNNPSRMIRQVERRIEDVKPSVKKVQKVQKPQPAPKTIQPVQNHLLAAIEKNGWDPENPPKLKSGYYMDPRELFYRTMKVQLAGGIDAAGRDGQRFIELLTLLAQGYMGRIMFKDSGRMSNLNDDMIQEAITKCAMIVMRFSPWDTRIPGKIKLNNAFAYFTTVVRNRFYETLGSALCGSDVFLEDLKTENQSVSDLI